MNVFHWCKAIGDNGNVLKFYWRDLSCSVGPSLVIWRRREKANSVWDEFSELVAEKIFFLSLNLLHFS